MSKEDKGLAILGGLMSVIFMYMIFLGLFNPNPQPEPIKTQSHSKQSVVAPVVDEVVPEVETEVVEDLPVRLTYYSYEGNKTASGHSPSNFGIHQDLGAFTFEGKLVVATANLTRLKWQLYEGYKSFELYEEFDLVINDTIYPAIVLDVCGACYGMSHESVQRIDVYVNSGVKLPDLATLRVVYE